MKLQKLNLAQTWTSEANLSIHDAAKRLGVSTKTLRRWEDAGKVIPSRTFGNQRRYSTDQINNVMNTVIPTKAGIGIGFFGKRQILAFARMTSIAIGILLVAIGVFTELVKPNEKTKNISYEKITPVSGSVLAAATPSALLSDFIFSVNVPALYTDTATFNKGITVVGDVSDPTGTGIFNKVTASNVLYGITAGGGLSVSSGQTPTIANTGVLSLGGKTGNVVLTAGDGMTVDGATITNKDPGSAQLIFKTINDIEASSNTDTVTFAQGGQVTITTNAAAKTLTIDSLIPDYGISGWTKTGAVVGLTTPTDTVDIGLSSFTAGAITGANSIFSSLDNSSGSIIKAGLISGATGLTSSGQILFSAFAGLFGIVHSDTIGLLSSSPVSFSSGDTSGVLPAARGGTALTVYTIGGIPFATSPSAFGNLLIGNPDEVLVVSAGAPTWSTVTGGSGGICTDCLVTDSGSTQTILPTTATASGLIVRQALGGIADIFKITNAGDTASFLTIDKSGNIMFGSSKISSLSTGIFTVNPAGTDPIAITPVATTSGFFTGTFTTQYLTAARTWTFPDLSGIICTMTGNCSGTPSSLGGGGIANYISRWSDTYLLSTSSLYDTGTYVGIGTTAPSHLLDVLGTANISGAGSAGSSLGVAGNTNLSGTLQANGTTSLSSTLGVSGIATFSSTLGITGNTTIGGNVMVNGTGSSYFSTGKVGIGTTNPPEKLTVVGNISSQVLAGVEGVKLTNTDDISKLAIEWNTGSVRLDVPSAAYTTNRFTNGEFETDTAGWNTDASASWWLAGGISASNAIAAYQPVGAADLANSYINKANPGTYDAAPGVAPTWTTSSGWYFNTGTQYLTTGIVPANTNWSIIARVGSYTAHTYNAIAGGSDGQGEALRFGLWAQGYPDQVAYLNGKTAVVTPMLSVSGGTLAVAGLNGYRNGIFDTSILSGSQTTTAIDIGKDSVYLTSFGLDGYITSLAIYNSTLTAPQVLSVSNAMNEIGLTTTRDATVKYSGSYSTKLVANSDALFVQSITLPTTNTYTLTAYAYTTGAAVTTTDLDLYYDTGELTTTFTSMGNGWYKLTGTLTGVASAKNYGVRVHAGKTVYVDSFSLTENTANKLVNGGFDTDITTGGWTSNSLLDQFTTSAPTTLVSGVSGLTNAGVITPAVATTGGPLNDGELLTDPGMEVWTNPTNLTNYGKTITGTSSVNQETTIKHGGSNATRLDVDASNSQDLVNQVPTPTMSANIWFQVSYWGRSSASGKTLSFYEGTSTIPSSYGPERDPGTTWTQYFETRRTTAANPNFQFSRRNAASGSLYYDDVSVKPLTLSSLFSTVVETTANKIISTGVTLTPGTQAGIVVNADATFANFIIAYHDGTKVYFEKNVGGTYSSIFTAVTATYVANATLKVIKLGNVYQVVYNNVLIGSGTVSDAGIVAGTKQGLFSTLSTNSFTNFLITTNLDGTQAEPTGGVRTVIDTGSHFSISSGTLNSSGGSLSWTTDTPIIFYPAQTRVAGKAIISSFNTSVSGKYLAMGFAPSVTATRPDVHIKSVINSILVAGYDNLSVGAGLSTATPYTWAIVMKTSGDYYFIKGGTYTSWTLVYIDSNSTGTYPALFGIDSTTSFDNLKIPTNLWLPTPLAYDTFSTTAGLTETTGPDGQVAPSLAWSNATKNGTVMSVTPTAGTSLWDSAASAFTSGIYSWTAVAPSTLTNDSGTLKGTNAGSSNVGAVYLRDASDLSSNLTVGDWYSLSADVKVDSSYGDISLTGAFTSYVRNTNTTSTNKTITYRAASTTGDTLNMSGVQSGVSEWLDNLSFKPLTLSTLFSTVNASTSNVIADVTIPAYTDGTQAGLVIGLDSATTPTNFLIAYLDGFGKARVEQRLASTGLYTTVVTAATATWNTAYVLRVIKDGTAVRLYYNNVLIGTGTCDASITGTLHGVFSTYSGNTFDNFTLWARGTGNEYLNIPDVDLTASRDATVHYAGTASLKLIAGTNDNAYTQSVTLPDTSTYNLSAYAYIDGTTPVTSAYASLYYDGGSAPLTTPLATTYTSVGNGWYRMSASFAGVASANNYGVMIKAGRTVYIDSLNLSTAAAGASTLAIANSVTGLGGLSVESTTTLNSGLASLQALIVKGFSGQTANLQEWRDSAGNILGYVDSVGGLSFSRSTNSVTAYNFKNAAGTSVLDINTVNGNIGIGTVNPAAALALGGPVTTTTPAAPVPTAGNNVVANSTFDTDTSWTKSSGWTITGGVAVDTNSTGLLYQGGLTTIGIWYQSTFDIVNYSSGFVTSVAGLGTGSVVHFANGSYLDTQRATSTNFTGINATSTPGTLNIDNVYVRPLTLSTLFSLSSYTNSSDVSVQADVTMTGGTEAGIVLNLDSAGSPANFVIAYHDGTNVHLDKAVAGVYTSLINTAASYAIGGTMKVYKSGNNYSLYYNGVQVGITQSVTDAGIVNNTLHGLFSTYAGNSFANFSITPVRTTVYSTTPTAPTVTTGIEALSNIGFEGTYVAGLAPSWNGYFGSGTGTYSEEKTIIHGGVSSQKIAHTTSGWAVEYQGVSATAGQWYLGTAWIYIDTGSGHLYTSSNILTQVSQTASSASWTQLAIAGRAINTQSTSIPAFTTTSGAITTAYLDDFSFKPLTLSTLFSTTTYNGSTDITVQANATLTTGTQAGIVMNLDSISSPANFVIAYHDGTNVHLDKAVAGVYTSLINTAASYAAGATIQVIKTGTTYALYYNGVQKGTTQSITDTGIINNTLHGLFSTYASNSFTNFMISAVPTLAFTGFGNAGIFSPTTSALSFTTAGLERSRIDASGYVGIGTTTPGVTLDVAGMVRTNNNLAVNGGISNFTSLSDALDLNKTLGPNATDSWSTGAAGGTPRDGYTSILYNGKIYSWAGENNSSVAINTMDIYDIAAGTWSTGTAGGTPRVRSGSVLYNGKIYSWAGNNSSGTAINTMDIYDIATNSWTTGAAGGTTRWGHTSILYNGKIYNWGGINGAGTRINTMDIYDIATNSWTTGAAGGARRAFHTSVLYNGKIYSWAGTDVNGTPTNTLDIYDIATNSWTTGAAGGAIRYDHTSVLYNGKMYSWGGSGNGVFALNTLYIYDIATDSWTTGATGGTARSNHTSVLYNGKIYSWGGYDINYVDLNTLDVYDIGFKQNILALQENGQDTLDFQTGSQLFLNSGRFGIMGGNVGIGTTAPAFTLDVNGSGKYAQSLSLGGSASTRTTVYSLTPTAPIPIVGSEVHTEANAASDPNGNEANATTGWSGVNVTLVSASADPNTGTYYLQGTSTTSSASNRFEYTHAATIGTWYQTTFDMKYSTTGAQHNYGGTPVAPGKYATASWVHTIDTIRASATTVYHRLYLASLNAQGRLDNYSIKPLTLSSLFNTVPYSDATDITVQANVTKIDGTQGGVVMNLDSASSPSNFVIAYLITTTGGAYAVMEKAVGGVYTLLIYAATTYVPGATIQIVKTGTTYALYYNGLQKGTTQSITDTGIINNTLHGLFSTYTGNTFTGFQISAMPALVFTNAANAAIFSPTTNILSFTTAGLERSRIDASGYVGIGITSPGVTLDVAGMVRMNNNLAVNGGISNFTSLNDVLNLNKTLGPNATDSWSTGAAGGTARDSHTSILYNGKIYSWGGTLNGGTPLNTMVIYDIASNSWTTGTAGGTARKYHSSVLYNGKIYSWGGQNVSTNINTVDIYTINSDSWSTGAAGGTGRLWATSVLYNGKIYSWGGYNSSGSVINTVDIYDIAANSWTTGAAGGTARVNYASVLYNGKIYSWGGYIGNSLDTNTMDIYDIASNSWTTGAAGGTPRDGHSSVLYNGKIYSWGGENNSWNAINTMDIYDIATGTWTTGTAGGTARQLHTSVLYNGKMYSWGGTNSSSNRINTLDIYDIGFKQNILALQENGQDTLDFQTGSQLFLNSGRFGIMGGNVGIGTTAPAFTLDVNGTGRFAQSLTMGSGATTRTTAVSATLAAPTPVAGTPTANWWLAGGVSAANAVAAYQPTGAASLAASYTNLTGNATYNAAPGVAPTWDVTNGWIFDGSTQYLNSGVVPATNYSLIIKFSNNSITNRALISSSENGQISLFGIWPHYDTQSYWDSGNEKSYASFYNSGVAYIGGTKAYINGVNIISTLTGTISATYPVYIGAASHVGGGAAWYSAAYIQSAAIYSSTLTATQVASVTMAMNGVNSTNFSTTSYLGPQDITVQVNPTLTAGSQAGLVMNLDNASTPLNFILAYHDGTNAHLDKYVAGVPTSLINTASTYVAGQTIKVVKTGTTYQLFYNGSQVGTNQTVTDAGIINNTLDGVFSTLSTNTFASFSILAMPALVFTNAGNAGIFSPTTSALSFTTAGLERSRIDASGYVGIGITSPGVTLDVAGMVRMNNNLAVNGGISNFTSLSDALDLNKTLGPNATDSWSTGAAGGTPRKNYGSVLYNGKMYSWGGFTTNGTAMNTLDIYDIASGVWSTGTTGGTSRGYPGFVLYNGKIYSWGGVNSSGTKLNTLDIYDIASNSWTTGATGGTARSTPRSVLYNGKIYSWGGKNSSNALINTLDIYDIAANSWSTGAAGGTARQDHSSVVYNGKIYNWGGLTSSAINTLDIYDIAANSWSTGAAGGTARFDHTSVVYNGKIYNWGGENAGGTFYNTLDIYDIASNSWTTGAAGGTPRDGHGSTVYNGKIYNWAGENSGGTVLNTLDVYDIGFKQNILALQENGQDTLDFQTGSQLFLNSGRFGIMGGNVGIGTASPTYNLDVNGTGRFNQSLAIGSSASTRTTVYSITPTAPVPTVGSEIHTQANAASDPNGNEANATTGWSNGSDNTLVTDNSSPYAGSYSYISNRFQAVGASFARYQFTPTANTWYFLSAYAKLGTGSAYFNPSVFNFSGIANLTVSGTSWAKYAMSGHTTDTTNVSFYAYNSSLGNFYLDNVSVKPLTLSSLFSTVTYSGSTERTVQVDVTMTAGTQAGVVMSLDSATSPANFIIAYHDGTNVHLEKAVAGVYTSLVNIAATYVAGATIKVVRTGTQYALYYNNIQKGTTQTITDSSIINNSLHGLFSTYSTNSFANFIISAVPTVNFNGVANAAIQSPTTSTLAFTTAGLERMRIASNQYVGIGTTAPTAMLDVAGSASVSGALTFRGATAKINAENGNSLAFQTSAGGDLGLSTVMTITNNGLVGIGTTAPMSKLQVNGTIGSDVANGMEGLRISTSGVTDMAIKYTTNGVASTGSLDTQTASTYNKFLNPNFDTNLTNWNYGNTLEDQFTTSAPTTLVSGVSGLTNGGVITPVSGSELIDGWTNNSASYPYETFTSSGSTITSAINTTGSGGAYKNIGAVSLGQWYLATLNITLNSGAYPLLGALSGNNLEGASPNLIGYQLGSVNAVSWRVTNARANDYFSIYNVGNVTNFSTGAVSTKLLTLSSLFSTVNAGNQNVVVSAGITLTPGTQAGIVMNLDSASNPQNFVLIYHDGTKMYVEKCVNGVYSVVDSRTSSYFADAIIKVKKNGTKYNTYYVAGGVTYPISPDLTISDASIVNNTRQGLFSTLSTNSFTNFLITTNLDGTLATDGVNTRNVTDTSNALSTSGGSATFGPVGSSQYGNPGIWYNSNSRNLGKMIVVKSTATTTSGSLPAGGWDTNTSSTLDAHAMYTSSGELRVYDNNVVFSTLGDITNGTDLYWAVVLRSTGAYYYAKGGGIFTNWTLVWISNSISTTPLYPAIYKAGTGTSSFQSVKIPTNLWLPTPLAYDTFSTTSSLTETVGPDTQITPQLTWTGGIKNGTVMNITPTLGNEIVSNGGFSSSLKWDFVQGNWSIAGGVLHASTGYGAWYQLVQTLANQQNEKISNISKTYQISYTLSNYVQGNFRILPGVPYETANVSSNGTYSILYRASQPTNTSIYLQAAANSIFDIDNVSIIPYNISSLFSTIPTSTNNVIEDVTIPSYTLGTQAGLVIGLDSATTPTNFLIAYLDGSGKATVEQRLASTGLYSTVVTAATAAWNTNYVLRVVKDGTAIRLYYNNVLIGTGTCDASITGTNHGVFSTYSGNTFDNFTLWSRGSNNEYSDIPDTNLTVTNDTATTYGGSLKSTKIIATSGGAFTQSVNVGDTNSYILSAAVYTAGGAVTSADVQMFGGSQQLLTTFTSLGNGWYRASASITGITSSKSYGVYVHAGKTIYLDNLALIPNSTTNNFTNASLDSGLTGWTYGNALEDQFTTALPATLVSGVGTLTNGGVITPATGTDVVINGSFDTDTSWQKGDAGWTINGGVAIDNNSSSILYENGIVSVGTWYQETYDISNYSSGVVQSIVGLNTGKGRNANGSYVDTVRAVNVNFTGINSSLGKLNIDNVLVKPLTLSSLFSTVDTSVSKVSVSADVTLTPGTQAGVVTNMDAGGTNFIIAYHDGTNVHLEKSVNGTYTSLLNVAAGYADGRTIKVTRDASGYTLWYNGAVVTGSPVAVADATIIGNTIHGLFSTLSTNSFANFLVQSTVNGSTAEPTGGTRTVVDTNGKISITGSVLNFATGGADGATSLWYPLITRNAGSILLGNINGTNGYPALGLDSNTSGSLQDGVRIAGSTGAIVSFYNGAPGPNIGTSTAGTEYKYAIIAKTTGYYLFVKGGTEYPNWTFLYTLPSGTGNLYPVVQNQTQTSGVFTADNIKIPTNLWLPTPLAYDTFTTAASTATETAGPDSQATPSLAWTNTTGTWSTTGTVAQALTLSGGIAVRTVTSSTSNVIIDATLIRGAGNGGIIARYQDSSNYLYAYHDGTNMKLYQVVAGSSTQLITGAATYGATYVARLVLDGTAARLYYNNALVGTATVPASTYTVHGLYTTDLTNTFDNFTLWNRSGYNVPDSDITASAESARTYAGSPGSVKLIGGSDGVNGSTFTQTITLPDTNPYTLSANVYTTGAAVTAADAELFAGTNTVPVTSFTALSGGWYRMTASITGITSSQSYGVYVHAGKTVYVDNFGLAEANASASTLAVQNAQTGLGQLFVESTTNLNTGLSSLQGLIVKGAFSQTANLQEWQNSAGVVFTSVLANGLVNATTGGLATFYKAGTGITNADFADTVPNGTLAVDAADNALYIRSGGAWKYITFTGGFQIPKEEAAGMTPGDYLLPYAESTMENGNLHGLYAKFSDVKGLLFASESAVLASLSATLHQDFAWQASISAQVNSVIFHKNINVLGVVTFNSDRAGEAIISKDSSAVDVHFAHPYAQPPVVTFSLVVPESSGSATFIDEGHQAYLAGVTSEGFTIVLPNLAIHDYLYQWTAFSVSDMTTTVSKP